MDKLLRIEGLSKLVIGALIATIVCDLFAMWVDVREIQLMNRILDGDLSAVDERDASDDRQTLAGGLRLLVFAFTILAFLTWFARAYRNVASLGASQLRYGSGWAIGGWFVPVLNLWRPKQLANDIWRASDPNAAWDQGGSWRSKPVPKLLLGWWVFWVVSLYVWSPSIRLVFTGDEPGQVRDANYADIVSLSLDLVAAALAIAVVVQVTRRQAARVRSVAVASMPRIKAAQSG
jgi:hypothetical protein